MSAGKRYDALKIESYRDVSSMVSAIGETLGELFAGLSWYPQAHNGETVARYAAKPDDELSPERATQLAAFLKDRGIATASSYSSGGYTGVRLAENEKDKLESLIKRVRAETAVAQMKWVPVEGTETLIAEVVGAEPWEEAKRNFRSLEIAPRKTRNSEGTQQLFIVSGADAEKVRKLQRDLLKEVGWKSGINKKTFEQARWINCEDVGRLQLLYSTLLCNGVPCAYNEEKNRISISGDEALEKLDQVTRGIESETQELRMQKDEPEEGGYRPVVLGEPGGARVRPSAVSGGDGWDLNHRPGELKRVRDHGYDR